ncbi:MAG TPA: 2-C-methyl-D-erythritol 4-phosphate cytidylyltransferase, partial [Noviherbaspirillum sp.]
MNAPRHFALIPAAGVGARMGAQGPKQYLQLAGKPMLRHVLETFTAIAAIDHVYVVVSAEDGYIASVIDDELAERVTVLRCGGATRQESVRNGLRQMRADEHDWVLVHDAARPGLAAALVERLLAALGEDEVGGLLALPVVDTLKRAGTDSRVQATVSREQL